MLIRWRPIEHPKPKKLFIKHPNEKLILITQASDLLLSCHIGWRSLTEGKTKWNMERCRKRWGRAMERCRRVCWCAAWGGNGAQRKESLHLVANELLTGSDAPHQLCLFSQASLCPLCDCFAWWALPSFSGSRALIYQATEPCFFFFFASSS